jgi:serine/threonine protein kinase
MLDARGHVKIIDFGLAKEVPRCSGFAEVPLSLTGSLIYMPPELLITQKGGRHTDWWAVGVLAHELFTGRTPWSSLTNKKVIRREIKSLKVGPPPQVSPAAGLLVCSLLRQDPLQRLGSIQSVRSAPFFSMVDFHQVEKQSCAPAFDPPPDCFRLQDRQKALGAYAELNEILATGLEVALTSVPAAECTLGLEVIAAHPLCSGVSAR